MLCIQTVAVVSCVSSCSNTANGTFHAHHISELGCAFGWLNSLKMNGATELESRGLTLRLAASIDSRSDQEIINELNTHVPVTSERNLWIFWDSGIESMPAWTQRSVINCVRRQGVSWTVRLLNGLPTSPNYIFTFVQESDFPTAFIDGRALGKDSRQHFSDFARLAMIYRVCLGTSLTPCIVLTRAAWRHIHRCRSDTAARSG
jgi:hypothetical protein